jgi:hypothetical protein
LVKENEENRGSVAQSQLEKIVPAATHECNQVQNQERDITQDK